MKRFERTPHELLRDRSVSLQAKAVYAILRDMIWEQTGKTGDSVYGPLPSLNVIANTVGCSKSALTEYLKELRDAEWLTTIRKARDRPQFYLVHGSRGLKFSPPVDRNSDHLPIQTSTDSSKETLELATRPRNVVFDALVEATHANPAQGSMVGKAARDIRTAMEPTLRDLRQGYLAQNPHEDEVPKDVVDELIAGQIRIRADLYRRHRPEWELTPTALAKHWNRIATWQTRGGLSPTELGQITDEEILGG